MNDFGMRKNGEGYPDPTAYAGVVKAAKPGEVWTHSNGVKRQEVLVIKNHGAFSTVLALIDESKSSQCIQIQVDGLGERWTNPAMLHWRQNASFAQFIKKLPDDDFEYIVDEVKDALKIDIEVKKRCVKSSNLSAGAQKETGDSLEGLKVQLETYKQLYVELLGKIIASGAKTNVAADTGRL